MLDCSILQLLTWTAGVPFLECRIKVEAACREIGGKLVEAGGDVAKGAAASLGAHRFSFSFLQRQWNSNWGGSPHSSSCGST